MLPQSPFTRSEALDSGITSRDWRHLSHERLVREVYPGYFVDASLPDTIDLRLAIVSRILPSDVVVARRAAAWLHGLELLDHRGLPGTPPLEVVTKERGRRPRHSLVSAHVSDDLLSTDVTRVGGLQVTTPLRTATDLLRFAPRTDALVAADAFLHSGLVTSEQMTRSLVRWRRRRGVRQAYEIAGLADGRSESGGESRMRLRILDMGLPRPELQIPVYDAFGNIRFWLDLGWKHWRLALEYDGEVYHGPEKAEHDKQRRTWIGERDWAVRAYRKQHIFTASQLFESEVRSLATAARTGTLEPGYIAGD